jgi:hypothetical protein
LLERSLAEVKCRSKDIGRFPGETSCLTLARAVLELYLTHAKNGVRFNQIERQRLARMGYADTETERRASRHKRARRRRGRVGLTAAGRR